MIILKINDFVCRQQIVSALAESGYPVHVERKNDTNPWGNDDYYIIIETDERKSSLQTLIAEQLKQS